MGLPVRIYDFIYEWELSAEVRGGGGGVAESFH